MSGHAYFRVHIYACPEAQVQAVQQVLAHHLGVLFDDGEPLDLADSYSVEEARTEHISQFVADLRKAGHGASWVMWTDPAGGGLGELHAYTPERGLYGPVSCDAGGNVVFTLAEVAKTIDSAIRQGAKMPLNSSAVSVALHRAMGGPWKDDWEAHRND